MELWNHLLFLVSCQARKEVFFGKIKREEKEYSFFEMKMLFFTYFFRVDRASRT
jgi:hypothetical protein